MTPNAWVIDIAPFKPVPLTRTQRFLVDADGVRPGGDDILHPRVSHLGDIAIM